MKFIYLFFGILLTTPLLVSAQEFNNFLVGIPGVTQGEAGSFDGYIQAVYVMFISVAALLAVVKIIIAGVKYMFTDIVTQKGQAKKDIQGALLGLLIVLSAVLILTVINPELTNFNLDANQVQLLDQISPEQTQSSYETCTASENCSVENCAQTSTGSIRDGVAATYDCTSASQACDGDVVQISLQQIACISDGTSSINEDQNEAALTFIAQVLSNNDDYSELVEIYAINNVDQSTGETLTGNQLRLQIENYEADCYDLEDNDPNTDNEYMFFSEGNGVNVNVYFCARS